MAATWITLKNTVLSEKKLHFKLMNFMAYELYLKIFKGEMAQQLYTVYTMTQGWEHRRKEKEKGTVCERKMKSPF